MRNRIQNVMRSINRRVITHRIWICPESKCTYNCEFPNKETKNIKSRSELRIWGYSFQSFGFGITLFRVSESGSRYSDSGSHYSEFQTRGHVFRASDSGSRFQSFGFGVTLFRVSDSGSQYSDSGSRYSEFRIRGHVFQSSITYYLMNHSTNWIQMSDKILLVHIWPIRSEYFSTFINRDENPSSGDFQNVTFFRGYTFLSSVRGDVFLSFWHPANLP